MVVLEYIFIFVSKVVEFFNSGGFTNDCTTLERVLSWETRTRSGRLYYYRAIRKNGRTIKEYCGHGIKAHAAAQADRVRRAERAVESQRLREFETGLWPIQAMMKLIRDACRQAYYAAHYVSGYHHTGSYNWRRSKDQFMEGIAIKPKSTDQPGNNTTIPESVNQPGLTKLPENIEQTLQLLKAGRKDLLPHLRWQLRQVPQLFRHCGDLGRLTQAALARAIAGDDNLIRESIMLVADQDRLELAGDKPTAAQQLLAERVVLSRMQVAMFEQFESQNAVKLLGSRIGQSVEKRLQSANHQLRESVRQLETVRRLDNEMAPRKTASALRIYNPDQQRKSA